MAMTGIRFRPPNLRVPLELDWVLSRAFDLGQAEGVSATGLARQEVCELAQKLSLAARIRIRTPRELLEEEVGSARLGLFDRQAAHNTGLALQHEQVCREVADLASQLSVPVIWLKGMALHFLEATSSGSRHIGDIDVLASKQGGKRLFEALVESGCEPSGIRPPEHHLSLLRHPTGSAIEIHHEIDGVRFERGGFVTAGQCLQGNRVVEAAGFPQGVFLPVEPLLVAHLLAHGLSHHGKAPEAYPPFQLLGDLQDLGLGRQQGRSIDSESIAWVASDVSGEEVRAVIDVLERLSAGEPTAEITGGASDAATLLRHWLAGSLDPDYLQALKLGRRLEGQSGRGGPGQIARTSWRALWLSDKQVEMLYGRPKTTLGYLGWRLWRPLDLIGRTLRSVAASLRLRRRR